MNNIVKNTKSKLRIKGIYAVLIVCAFLGSMLIMLGADNKDQTEHNGGGLQSLDPDEYAKRVEEQVEELCNRIDGVSGTYAVVALKGGYRALYASDEQMNSGNRKNQVVLIGSGGDENGLLVGYENPEISGIGIVCSGGEDYNIKKDIISVVSAAFGLPSNKIFVTGG